MPVINPKGDSILSVEDRAKINNKIDQKRKIEDLENLIDSLPANSTTRNFEKDYGITREHLNLLTTESLKNIYFGTQMIDIPHEMLVMNNAHEILGQYLAIGKIKKDKKLHKKLGKYTSNNIAELIKEINKIAYSRTGLGNVKAKEEKPHYDELQSERMRFLPTRFTKRFLNSFRKKYDIQDLGHLSTRSSYIDAILLNLTYHSENERNRIKYINNFLNKGKNKYKNNITYENKDTMSQEIKQFLNQFWTKFKPGRKQDLNAYKPMEIISLFNQMYEGYQKSIRDTNKILNPTTKINK